LCIGITIDRNDRPELVIDEHGTANEFSDALIVLTFFGNIPFAKVAKDRASPVGTGSVINDKQNFLFR
jgi:hypothetical protein